MASLLDFFSPGQYYRSLEMPAVNSASVSPSDSSPLQSVARAIYVGTTGNLAVQLLGDTAPTTFYNVQAGTLLPIRAAYVFNTNTTASNIVALW